MNVDTSLHTALSDNSLDAHKIYFFTNYSKVLIKPIKQSIMFTKLRKAFDAGAEFAKSYSFQKHKCLKPKCNL